MGLMRIPYTDPLPAAKIFPRGAESFHGAVEAVVRFLSSTSSPSPSYSPSSKNPGTRQGKTLLLTGAGISVASGLADYRGTNGTYTLNKSYRPIYYGEFVAKHDLRKRYWARSFLGWTGLETARANAAHVACGSLGELGVVRAVVTQNVDSFHPTTHPHLPTLELHGYLRSLVCLTCHHSYPRSTFQSELSRLNPSWSAFLAEVLASGALDTEDPGERYARGLRTNPDGDVDVAGVDYGTFRYPACPTCLEIGERIELDADGAWMSGSTAGVLKPAVVMFGESIAASVKEAAERAVDESDRVLVVGSSLATYSAWRLVKRAREQGKGVGIVNLGGVRGEEAFFGVGNERGVRVAESSEMLLPEVVKRLEGDGSGVMRDVGIGVGLG